MVRNVAILSLSTDAPFRGAFPLYEAGGIRCFSKDNPQRFVRLHAVIGVAWALSGCSESPVTPGGPFPTIPSGPAPAVTEVLPSAGSTAGGATVKIVGTGFTSGMTATFGGTRVSARYDSRSPTIFYAESPAHAAGNVDLVLANPGGQSLRLPDGYTYAPPGSFDPNGIWGAIFPNGTDTWVQFEIRDNRLVSASCQYDDVRAFAFTDFPTVENGEFSFTADDGAKIWAGSSRNRKSWGPFRCAPLGPCPGEQVEDPADLSRTWLSPPDDGMLIARRRAARSGACDAFYV